MQYVIWWDRTTTDRKSPFGILSSSHGLCHANELIVSFMFAG